MSNEELLRIIQKAARDKATKLHLSGQSLTSLPAEIGQLTALTQLYLGGNQLTTLPAEIGQLTALTELYLGNNQLTTLPAEIGQLTALTQLDLSNNQLTSLSAEIGQLTALTRLYLGDNQLTSLPAEIGQLTALTQLYLSDNQLTSLPAEIGQLTALTLLYLSNNQLKTLPAEMGQLTAFTELYLSNNQLTSLPAEIGQLTALTEVRLSDNQLTTLPAEIVQLTALTVLSLSYNQLTTLPAEIVQLTALTELYLGNNQLTTLPAEIVQLTALTELYLGNNQLTSLPAEIVQLTKLEILDLRNNQLTTLPPEIQPLTHLKKLDLRGNQLPIPPEILGDDWYSLGEPSQILSYYFSLQAEQKKPLNEAKVLLVGQGDVGKTSLVKRLIENSYDPHQPKTEGINIQNWQIIINNQSIRLNVWDFGGQEIMHATHQFFLTKRSLYLLVLKSRDDERQNQLEYWLKMIQSFGDDSPIILVGNQIDDHPLDIDQRGLRQKYPSIKDIVPVSCKTGEGLEQLQSTIINELSRLEHIHDVLPRSWFQVKTRLEQMENDYIPYSDYERLCLEELITDKVNQITLIELLHRLGIVLNFRDDPRLEDTHVLNPEWVTNAVYKILNDNRLITEFRGILEGSQLHRILDSRQYPRSKQQFIIEMMRKFELCFPLEGGNSDRYLIPDLLPKEEPATGDWKNVLAFQYHYNVLPSSIISRFIVRMHHHGEKRTWWRSGIVLKYQNNRALVKSDQEDRKIFISISGPTATRRELLAMIRSQFDAIHQTIKGLVPEEKVPIPGYPNIVADYKNLLVYAEKNLPIIPEGLTEAFNARELLNGIETEEERRQRDKDHETIDKPRNINNQSMNNPPQPPDQKPPSHISSAERGIALGMALVVLITFIVLVLSPRAMNGGTLAIVRFLAASFAGIAGYLFAGNLGLEAKIPLNKTELRATGAFAAFVLVLLVFYVGVPAQL